MARKNDDSDNPVLKKYMKDLKWRMFWMSGKKKKLLMGETVGHLLDIASDIKGHDRDAALRKAIDRFGSVKSHAKSYKYQYGYGMKFLVILLLTAILFSAMTIPVLSNLPPVGETEEAKENLQTFGFCCGATSVIFLILTFSVIIFAGVKGGRWFGLVTGLAAMFSRFGLMTFFIAAFSLISKILTNLAGGFIEINLNFGGGQICATMFISLLMPVAGFIAGRGIKSLRKGDVFQPVKPGAIEEDDDEELELF